MIKKYPAINEWFSVRDIPADLKYYFTLHNLDYLFLAVENAEVRSMDNIKDFDATVIYLHNNGTSETGYTRQAIRKAIILYLGIEEEEFDHILFKYRNLRSDSIASDKDKA